LVVVGVVALEVGRFSGALWPVFVSVGCTTTAGVLLVVLHRATAAAQNSDAPNERNIPPTFL
jgi:hypothetical protein